MNKTDIVRKFITENPKITKKKEIARLLFEANPETFKDIENARSFVRSVTGSNGIHSRDRITRPDKNGNGTIDSSEWIKMCPCFDAIPEYKNLL